MSDHNSAVFNNSCLKIPRNPISKKPFPVYDQKYLNQLENQARKLSLESNDFNLNKKRSPEVERGALKSFIEFYDSIPEYDDVNHLSSKEFYRKLEILKEQQRNYRDYLENEVKYETKSTNWIDDYKNMSIGEKKYKQARKSSIKPFCSTPISLKPPIIQSRNEDNLSDFSFDKEINVKPPSRRSVRIESPSDKISPEDTPELNFFRSKSRANISSAGSKGFNANDSRWEDFSTDDSKFDCYEHATRSVPNSPSKTKLSVGWKDCGITIPKPFQMTVRDEENQIVEDLMCNSKKPNEGNQDLFRAHSIPIESQIPLFDKIMSDQERRRQKIKKKSKAALMAQMRPFSFTKRDEEIQAINNRLSKSSPCIFSDEPPIKVKAFKAKPVPRNLFSNYIYQKMHEDEFYRALQKKIRSEEMLKAASLPPSMAKRERKKPKYKICPRSFKDLGIDAEELEKPRPRSASKKYRRNAIERELDELEQLETDFLRGSPCKPKVKKKGKRGRQSSAESKSTMMSNATLESVNRSNLAAVLRIQSARSRLEMEMCRKLEEAKLRDEARWREKVMRKKPVWQSLAYSHEEDLAMRLELRRDEERLRNEEHRHRMQLMLGRVNRQPTLFERQTHGKDAKTREELLTKFYKDLGRNSVTPNGSDSSGKRSLVEMKDEAIQARFDEMCKEEDDKYLEMREGGEVQQNCNCDTKES